MQMHISAIYFRKISNETILFEQHTTPLPGLRETVSVLVDCALILHRLLLKLLVK